MMERHPDIYIVTDTKEQEDQDIWHLFTEIVSLLMRGTRTSGSGGHSNL